MDRNDDTEMTGFFDDGIQEEILTEYYHLNSAECHQVIQTCGGFPGTFLEFMKNESSEKAPSEIRLLSPEEIIANAKRHMRTVWTIASRTEGKELIGLLRDVANGKQSLRDQDIETLYALKATGVIGITNGEFVMPPIAQEVILEKSWYSYCTIS